MLSISNTSSSATKRKADDISCDTSMHIVRPSAQRQRSISTATTISTGFDTMTPVTPASLRPASSHSTKMSTDDDLEDERSPITPTTDGIPKNFGRVMEGVYRSAFPQEDNLDFLKTLELKTILTLVAGPYPESHTKFVEENGIQHFQVAIEPNKNPFVTISHCSISFALGVLLDKTNYPILVHCNKGKHRTGCVVGCLRKILGSDISDVLDDYHHYADPKARVLDERYMELFDERSMLWLARRNGLLPPDEPRAESPIGKLAFASRLRS